MSINLEQMTMCIKQEEYISGKKLFNETHFWRV